VENVAALLTRGMDTVLGDLSEIGYDAEWHVIPASAVGAPHRRDRVWIVAYAVSQPDAVRGDGEAVPPAVACGRCDARGSVSDCGAGCSQEPGQGCGLGNANCKRQLQPKGVKQDQRGRSSYASWWETEPAVGRVANGVPNRVDRLRGLGNAVVPQIVELIGRAIIESTGGPAGCRE
jgi:DNA (cytosine-5)-methyltransferase 1